MNYEQAQQLVKTKWQTLEQSKTTTCIVIHKFLNSNTLYYIALYNTNKGAILTDFGKTCQYIDLSEKQFTLICKKHNLTFENWQIESAFNGLDDIENFISALDEICNNK